MTWIALAILSAATFGVVAVLDKRLLDKYVPSLSSYFVWVGLATLSYGIVFLLFNGIPVGAPVTPLIISVVSGFCWGGALALMLWGFKLQEVSRASIVLFTFPVFVAIFASLFLGETLAIAQWLAMGVVVFAAFIISLTNPRPVPYLKVNKFWLSGDKSKGKSIRVTRAFPILLGSSLFTALGLLTSKYALQDLSALTVTNLGFFGTGAVLMLFWRRETLSHLKQTMRHKEALVLLLVSEGLLIPVAVTSMITATSIGPVSLVATISATRPIFIFAYSAILSLPGIRILHESLDRRTLVVKIASVAMIIMGIVSL